MGSTDLNGDDRIEGAAINLGAYESLGALNVSESIVHVECTEDGDDSITLNVGGASGTPSYQWSNGEITKDSSGLNQGTFSVTVTDNLGSFAFGPYNLTTTNPACRSVFVDANATGLNNGLSWKDAYTDLEGSNSLESSDLLEDGVSVLIAENTAYSLTATLSFSDQLNIYGSCETSLNGASERTTLTSASAANTSISSSANADLMYVSAAGDFNIYGLVILDHTTSEAHTSGIQIQGPGGSQFLNTGLYNCRFENLIGDNSGALKLGSYVGLNVGNCSFDNCRTAYSSGGGAIQGSTASFGNIRRKSLTIDNSSFNNCRATWATGTGGGAISLFEDDAMSPSYKWLIDINGCIFSNCISTTEGGALSFEDAEVSLFDCEFRINTASYGGRIYIGEGTLNIQSCDFLQNTATSGCGGDIQISPTGVSFSSDGCTFEEYTGSSFCVKKGKSSIIPKFTIPTNHENTKNSIKKPDSWSIELELHVS